ncbi:MAG: hypothetical protein ACM3Q0_06610, partial [Bacteroidota bacterium]
MPIDVCMRVLVDVFVWMRADGRAPAHGCGCDDVRGLHPSRVSLETLTLSAEYAVKRERSGVATTWLTMRAIGYS